MPIVHGAQVATLHGDRRQQASRSLLRSLLLGPLAAPSIGLKLLGLLSVLAFTVLTQLGGPYLWALLGGMAWARGGMQRWLLAPGLAVGLYLPSALWLFPLLAHAAGREALPCWLGNGALRAHSPLYCLCNRHYVVPELARQLEALDARLQIALPGRTVRWLDAGFPLGSGFPMLPHLSHGDGRRLDLMFLYRDGTGKAVDGNGSPIGYFAFEQPAAETTQQCPRRLWTLRWDLDWLQPWLNKPELDEAATARLINAILSSDQIGKLLLEPHLRDRLRLGDPRIRFQGCHAARHDDHLHLQL